MDEPNVAKPGDFPTVRIVGGPAGHSVDVSINDQPVPKMHRIELVADVQGVVTAKLFQYVTLDIKVEAGVVTTYTALLNIPRIEAGERLWTGYQGQGSTLRDAVEDAVHLYEEATGAAE